MQRLGVLVIVTMCFLMSELFGLHVEGRDSRCFSKNAERLAVEPQIGQPFEPKSESIGRFMAGSAQSYTSYEACFDGIDFTIGIDDRETIAWIYTDDEAFQSPEGLRLGDPVDCALATTDKEIFGEPGWAFHLRLPSGWHAWLGVPFKDIEHLRFVIPQHGGPGLPDDAAIIAFFKRR